MGWGVGDGETFEALLEDRLNKEPLSPLFKRVELLKETFPQIRKLAVLSNAEHPGERSEWQATALAMRALNLEPAYVPFRGGRELDAALSEGDSALGLQVAEDDQKVNRMEVSIDEECSRILATRAPTAGDLRLVIAIIKTITDLLRMAPTRHLLAGPGHDSGGPNA